MQSHGPARCSALTGSSLEQDGAQRRGGELWPAGTRCAPINGVGKGATRALGRRQLRACVGGSCQERGPVWATLHAGLVLGLARGAGRSLCRKTAGQGPRRLRAWAADPGGAQTGDTGSSGGEQALEVASGSRWPVRLLGTHGASGSHGRCEVWAGPCPLRVSWTLPGDKRCSHQFLPGTLHSSGPLQGHRGLQGRLCSPLWPVSGLHGWWPPRSHSGECRSPPRSCGGICAGRSRATPGAEWLTRRGLGQQRELPEEASLCLPLLQRWLPGRGSGQGASRPGSAPRCLLILGSKLREQPLGDTLLRQAKGKRHPEHGGGGLGKMPHCTGCCGLPLRTRSRWPWQRLGSRSGNAPLPPTPCAVRAPRPSPRCSGSRHPCSLALPEAAQGTYGRWL